MKNINQRTFSARSNKPMGGDQIPPGTFRGGDQIPPGTFR